MSAIPDTPELRITHKSNIDFTIGANGQIQRTSTWEILPASGADILTSWTSFRADAETWAGAIGDPFRIPDADSMGYTTDDEYLITEIAFKSPARFIYEVTFTGRKKHTTAEMTDYSETKNNNLEKEKTARWLIHDDSIEEWLPDIGAVITWGDALYGVDELYMIDDIQKTKLKSGEWEVTLKAKDMAVLIIGNPQFTRTAAYESSKTAKWRVDTASYEQFIADNDIDSAATWAGDGYYVTNLSAEPHGILGYYITIEAKHVSVRQIEVLPRKSFAGYEADGSLKIETVYTGKWQVHTDNREEFETLVGESAEDWADQGYIVTSVNPVKLSDIEYEYTLEAKNTDSSAASPASEDDRSKLWERQDFYPGSADFKIDGPMSGWTMKDGKKKTIKESGGEWTAAEECPFVMTGEMEKKYAERVIQCLTVQVTQYIRKDPMLMLPTFKQLYEAVQINGDYLGTTGGSWRAVKQDGEKILDNEGKPWTKYTTTWMCAPFDWEWNATYWGA